MTRLPEPDMTCLSEPEPDMTCLPETVMTCLPETDMTCLPETDMTCLPEPEPDMTCLPETDMTCLPETDMTCLPEPETDMTCQPEPEERWRFRAFVSLLTIRALSQLGVTKTCSLAQWVGVTCTVSQSVMDGLSVPEGFCPDAKSIKKLCKAITVQVLQQLGARDKLDAVTVQQNPAVGPCIVVAMRSHIGDLLDQQQAREAGGEPRRWWRRLLPRKVNAKLVVALLAAATVFAVLAVLCCFLTFVGLYVAAVVLVICLFWGEAYRSSSKAADGT
ncbi:uncharacterized protein V6R79_020252 [Siganus canaliculatus]